MAREKFAPALERVLVHEGGYSNHKDDPGRATMKGVTQRVYDLHRKAEGLPVRSVKLISAAELQSIYRHRYWDVVKGDALPPGVDYAVFDGAVNSGPLQAVKWLQRALGALYTGKVDGMIGKSTIAAIEAHPNHDALIAAMLARRMEFLRALKTWKTFGNGWSARLAGVKAVGQAWAMGNVGPKVGFVAGGNAKALISDAMSPPSAAPGDIATGTGSAGALISQATDQLTPLASIEFVGQIVAVLTVAGVALAVGGIAWRTWAKRRKAALVDALDLQEAADVL